MTISSLHSETASQSESASSIAPIDDSFAIGAETIIGEDVFGLTISIDADGTTRPLSPESSTTPPGKEYVDRWFDPEEEYSNYIQEREEFDRLVEFAEVDVPVDFGDEEDTQNTPQRVPREVVEDWTDVVEDTRIWDITVPIRETSVLSEKMDVDENINDHFNEVRDTSLVRSIGHSSDGVEKSDDAPRQMGSKGRSVRSRSRRDREFDGEAMADPDTDSVENNRGLNISKLGLEAEFDTTAQSNLPSVGHDVQGSPGLDHQLQENRVSPSLEETVDKEVEEVDFTSRIPHRGSLARDDTPQFSSVSTGDTATSIGAHAEKDSLDHKAKRDIKGEAAVNL